MRPAWHLVIPRINLEEASVALTNNSRPPSDHWWNMALEKEKKSKATQAQSLLHTHCLFNQIDTMCFHVCSVEVIVQLTLKGPKSPGFMLCLKHVHSFPCSLWIKLTYWEKNSVFSFILDDRNENLIQIWFLHFEQCLLSLWRSWGERTNQKTGGYLTSFEQEWSF